MRRGIWESRKICINRFSRQIITSQGVSHNPFMFILGFTPLSFPSMRLMSWLLLTLCLNMSRGTTSSASSWSSMASLSSVAYLFTDVTNMRHSWARDKNSTYFTWFKLNVYHFRERFPWIDDVKTFATSRFVLLVVMGCMNLGWPTRPTMRSNPFLIEELKRHLFNSIQMEVDVSSGLTGLISGSHLSTNIVWLRNVYQGNIHFYRLCAICVWLNYS